jgi:hypothetical protein
MTKPPLVYTVDKIVLPGRAPALCNAKQRQGLRSFSWRHEAKRCRNVFNVDDISASGHDQKVENLGATLPVSLSFQNSQ